MDESRVEAMQRAIEGVAAALNQVDGRVQADMAALTQKVADQAGLLLAHVNAPRPVQPWESKRFQAALAGVVVVAAARLGFDVDTETALMLVGLVIAYLTGETVRPSTRA